MPSLERRRRRPALRMRSRSTFLRSATSSSACGVRFSANPRRPTCLPRSCTSRRSPRATASRCRSRSPCGVPVRAAAAGGERGAIGAIDVRAAASRCSSSPFACLCRLGWSMARVSASTYPRRMPPRRCASKCVSPSGPRQRDASNAELVAASRRPQVPTSCATARRRPTDRLQSV